MRPLTRGEFDALSDRLNTLQRQQDGFEGDANSIGATSGTLNSAIVNLSGTIDGRFAHASSFSVVTSGTVTAVGLRLTPTIIEDFLPAGLTNPFRPAGFNTGSQSTIHQRVSPFNSTIASLPKGKEGDIIVLVHAGDGGGTFTQAGVLTVKHMTASYDSSAGGDNSSEWPIYCPGQRDFDMLPADTLILRGDTGHTSWRVIAQTNSGRVNWGIFDRVSFHLSCSATTSLGHNHAFNPANFQNVTWVDVDTTAGAANIDGIVAPTPRFWNGAAYEAYGGDMRIIFNRGPNSLRLGRLSGSAAGGTQFLMNADVVLSAFDSVAIYYKPFGSGFWLIPGK